MSQRLGEVQIQVLRGFAKYHKIRESQGRQPGWIDLKSLKWYSWGRSSQIQGWVVQRQKPQYVQASIDGVGPPRRVTPTLEYRLTEKGKCAVDGYRAGSELGAGEECPILETDVEPFRAWREGWIAGQKISAS